MRLSRLFLGLALALIALAVAAPDVLAQGRIRGQIVNEDNEPLEGATIIVDLADDSRGPTETMSNEDGRFQFVGLTSGDWAVTISRDGFLDLTDTVQVTQRSTAGPQLNRGLTYTLTRVRSALELALGDEALEGLDPLQLEADLRTADAAYNAQDFPTALAGYEALLDVLPQLTNLYLQIGNVNRAMGNNEAALEAYDKLLEADPTNPDVKNEIARTRVAMGDLDAAAELAAATSESGAREDLYNLGEVEFAQGNVDGATEWYQKAADADPTWEKAWFKLGLMALNKGDMETAKEHFRKVVELAPTSEEGTQAEATLAALP